MTPKKVEIFKKWLRWKQPPKVKRYQPTPGPKCIGYENFTQTQKRSWDYKNRTIKK